MSQPPDSERLLDAMARYCANLNESAQEILLLGARDANEPLVRALLAQFVHAQITIVDPLESTIQLMSEALADVQDRLRLATGSAADLAELASGPYQLIVVRHPDIVMQRNAWEAALTACTAALDPGGLILLTTEQLADAGFIHDIVELHGLQMLSGTPYTAVPVALSGLDRYILIYEWAPKPPGN